ncbi:MAG: restriction endonuclease subunit S, partial [Sarcina sp.]
MNKNVPKLRFKEFNDEWKIDKLDENTYIKGRIGWKNLKQEEYTEEGPYLIAGKHINNGIINWEECDHIPDERYEESLEIALQNGDIIFSKDGSLGNPALIESLKEKATINGTMMLIRLDKAKYSSKYFYQVLQSIYFKKLIRNVKSGSSIPHIFQRDMIDFKFPITSLQEQEKIADFFTILDSLIEEQDGKVSDLELYKKGMMQKIFSQEIR